MPIPKRLSSPIIELARPSALIMINENNQLNVTTPAAAQFQGIESSPMTVASGGKGVVSFVSDQDMTVTNLFTSGNVSRVFTPGRRRSRQNSLKNNDMKL